MDPEEYAQYTHRGYFTIRRTDKFWSGVWSDMTVEQVLMYSMKTAGGLTRGRGITESTLAKWVCALPLCLPLCNALEQFTRIHPETSEQHQKHREHKDMRQAQCVRDSKDTGTFETWMESHPPFSDVNGQNLVSLSSGLVPDKTVTCHRAAEIGLLAQQSMQGYNFGNVKLHRKANAKPFSDIMNMLIIHDEEVVVNPQKFINIILCIIESQEDMKIYLKYELAP